MICSRVEAAVLFLARICSLGFVSTRSEGLCLPPPSFPVYRCSSFHQQVGTLPLAFVSSLTLEAGVRFWTKTRVLSKHPAWRKATSCLGRGEPDPSPARQAGLAQSRSLWPFPWPGLSPAWAGTKVASVTLSFLPHRSAAPAPGVKSSRLVDPRSPGAPFLATPVRCGGARWAPGAARLRFSRARRMGKMRSCRPPLRPGPAVGTPQRRAGCQAFPLLCGSLSRVGGASEAHPGIAPTGKGEGRAGGTSRSLPPTLHAHPSPAPYLAIPWLPPPLPYMVWGPLADPLPCPRLHEWPRRSSVVRRRPNKARWPAAPHPYPRRAD